MRFARVATRRMVGCTALWKRFFHGIDVCLQAVDETIWNMEENMTESQPKITSPRSDSDPSDSSYPSDPRYVLAQSARTRSNQCLLYLRSGNTCRCTRALVHWCSRVTAVTFCRFENKVTECHWDTRWWSAVLASFSWIPLLVWCDLWTKNSRIFQTDQSSCTSIVCLIFKCYWCYQLPHLWRPVLRLPL